MATRSTHHDAAAKRRLRIPVALAVAIAGASATATMTFGGCEQSTPEPIDAHHLSSTRVDAGTDAEQEDGGRGFDAGAVSDAPVS